VLISGWSGKVAEAKKVLATLDVPLPSPVPGPSGGSVPGPMGTRPQARTFEPRLLWEVHVGGGSLDSVAVGAGGRLLVSGETEREGVLYLLDTASGKTVFQVRVPFEGGARPVQALAISPDGKTVVAGVDNSGVILLDVATGKQLMRVPVGEVRSAAYAPDGRTLAIADVNVVHICDTTAGKETQFLRQSGVNVLAFSDSGSRIAMGGDKGVARILEVASGKELDHRILRGPITAIVVMPDGRVVAAESDRFYVWTPEVEAGVQRFATGQKSIESLAIAASGKHVHTGGADGTVKVWDLQTGKAVTHVAAPDWQRGVRVVPELPYFLTGGLNKPGETLRLWEIVGVQ